MKIRTALMLLAVANAANAVTTQDAITYTTRSVAHAFARYSAQIDGATLEKQLPAQASDLFPGYGFSPRNVPGLTWTLTPSGPDSSNFCVLIEVLDSEQWNDSLLGLSRAGFRPADPQTCAQKNKFGTVPAQLPATIAGMTTWDRRDTPSATVVPGYPVIQGVAAPAVTRAGLRVTAGTPATVWVYNPYVPGPVDPLVQPPIIPTPGLVVGIVDVVSRPEFSVAANCAEIASESSCSVTVGYLGTKPVLAGQLLIYFSNGAVANIGLEGHLR